MGEQTLRPLTVKQIKNCDIPQDDTYRIDNADVTQVMQNDSKMCFPLFLILLIDHNCRRHS